MGDRVASERRPAEVQVYIAACTGSARLSDAIGLPVVHVGVAFDAAHAIRRLNVLDYGSGVRVPHLFQPIGHERGWNDWAMFDYAPGSWRRGMGARPSGVRAVEGRLLVTLPTDVTIGEYREELEGALRHLRLHEVTSQMAYMERRSEAALEYAVEPRYAWNPRDGDFRGARRIDDLYVVDPAERPWWLFWTVVAASSAVVEATPGVAR